MKAIILAAGTGKRLQSILQDKPKPLFEIEKKSLLEYSLKALAKAGIKQVVIVIGYNGYFIKEKIGKEIFGIEIKYIENKIYNKTGSMHSLFSVFGESEPEDCLVLDGDIIYDPSIILEVINHKKENLAVLSEISSERGDEVCAILDKDNKVTYLMKKNPGQPTPSNFEFIGIAKFSKKFIRKMFELHKENLNKNIFYEYCEDCAYRTSKSIPWYGLVKKDLLWSEIDEPKDVERARRVLKNIW